MKEEICSNNENKNFVCDKQIIFIAITVLFFLIAISLSFASILKVNPVISVVPAANAQQQRPDIQASNAIMSKTL